MILISNKKEMVCVNKINEHISNNILYIPIGKEHPGSFGFKRKNHIHEGIDFYCNEYDEIYSLTSGIVIDKGNFTGELANSPWWNNTEYISIQYNEIVIVYGELIYNTNLTIGDIVAKGDLLGKITPVLKKNTNGVSQSMLHLETYNSIDYIEPKEWINEKPKGLINPIYLFYKLIGFEKN